MTDTDTDTDTDVEFNDVDEIAKDLNVDKYINEDGLGLYLSMIDAEQDAYESLADEHGPIDGLVKYINLKLGK